MPERARIEGEAVGNDKELSFSRNVRTDGGFAPFCFDLSETVRPI